MNYIQYLKVNTLKLFYLNITNIINIDFIQNIFFIKYMFYIKLIVDEVVGLEVGEILNKLKSKINSPIKS